MRIDEEVCPDCYAEDWMWLQLVSVREINRASEAAHEVFTLQDLQKSLTQFGAFWTKGQQCGVVFPDAVDVGAHVDGVHFAIGLTYYALLLPTTNPAKPDSELLVIDSKGETSPPNRLIHQRLPHPAEEAVDYLSLIVSATKSSTSLY
ncbi:nuclear pore complex subunit [Rhizina undulata]